VICSKPCEMKVKPSVGSVSVILVSVMSGRPYGGAQLVVGTDPVVVSAPDVAGDEILARSALTEQQVCGCC